MGFFSFFSKEKKETLDKGLSKTKESVFGKIARAVAGKSKVDDEVLDNLDKVAPAGALLIASWPRIEGATGLPARVVAITPKK